MARTLQRSHPLQSYESAFAALPEGISVKAEPYLSMTDLRLPEDVDGPLGKALPREPGGWVSTADGLIVWLGPDEWLVLSGSRGPGELEADLRDLARPNQGSAVDVSAQRISLRVRGRHARDLLSGGCSIDLHPSVFQNGRSAQTTLGLTGVVLLALGADGDDFRILVRSSFAGYLAEWLVDAATEYR
ncbi:sarcosine oxidase subunit gamma [Kineosporia babensis]|uniref:Sarcosine oxidase subunit gamma n=1 Tax=Kineosporia babensis TaxID=499548 RepID=A0A9X1ST67_9ACTN|nr:sarcosine oxidase subunit gamma family protein [Kineosporia babensis]MCD5311021.1 hypothetical protein [Kineosporia babensis]